MINWRIPLFVVTTACVVAAMPPADGARPLSHGRVDADTLRFEYKARHMGVVARIVVYAPNEDAARTASSSAFERIAAIDGALSNYRHNSELGRLVSAAARAPHPEPVTVSSDLLRVLVAADSMWRASEGAFDPTVGPLTTSVGGRHAKPKRCPSNAISTPLVAGSGGRTCESMTPQRRCSYFEPASRLIPAASPRATRVMRRCACSAELD